MNASTAIKSYAKVGIESSVLSADPHKLITMLFQGALLAIANARNGILRKDIPAKGAAISQAMAIIDDGLNASLDKKAGGELAQNLSALYSYMCTRLLDANLKNDIGALDEVAGLLGELKGAWDSIRSGATGVTAAPVATPQARETQPKAANKIRAAYAAR